jgi:hypothetical protein
MVNERGRPDLTHIPSKGCFEVTHALRVCERTAKFRQRGLQSPGVSSHDDVMVPLRKTAVISMREITSSLCINRREPQLPGIFAAA